MELGEKLLAITMRVMSTNKLSDTAVAEALDISRARWSNWKSRGAIAKDGFELVMAWLANFDPETGIALQPPAKPRDLTAEFVHVGTSQVSAPMTFVTKVTGAQLSAGNGEVIWEIDEVEDSHGFRLDYMQKEGLTPSRCRVWTVRGDSMEPRYRSGDIVLIDMSSREPIHGKVFALVGDEGLKIKQIRRGVAGGWEMHSFNADQNKYPPEPIVDGNYAIIGRVRWRGGNED